MDIHCIFVEQLAIMQLFKFTIMIELAKKICIYNGQTGTDKQVQKCIKGFNSNMVMMNQFAKGRLN